MNEGCRTLLHDHVLEERSPDPVLGLSDDATVVAGLSSVVVPTEDVGLVGFVVVGVDAVQGADLVPRQAGRRVLAGATGEGLGSEASVTVQGR